MIIFEGGYSKKGRKIIAKEAIKFAVTIMAFSLPLLIVVGVALMSYFSTMTHVILPCGIITVIGITICIFCVYYYNKPNKIIINEMDDDIFYDNKEVGLHRKISMVKEVFDMGDYYYIKFAILKNSPVCICQKDLLTQGTIEEFEKLFEGKIVRKID